MSAPRSRWLAIVVGSSLASASLVSSPTIAPTGAYACSCDGSSGPLSALRLPRAGALEVFPANGAFIGADDWRDEMGVPLALVLDTERSAALGTEVRRSAAPLPIGERFFDEAYCREDGTCELGFVVAEADEVPPLAAVITDATVELADGAPESGSSCQTDTLVLIIEGSDEGTPDDALGIVAWTAETAPALAEAAPAATFAFDPPRAGAPRRATIRLGQSAGHVRDGAGLSVFGPFCLAVALVDHAGNVGPRSEAHCLDTTDASDPSVELVPYAPACSGPFCAVQVGAARDSAASVLGFGALLVTLLARRRRRAP